MRWQALNAGRRGVRLGLVALACALAWGLWSQYRWLAQASEAAPALYRTALEGRLQTVAAEVERGYRSATLRALEGPADAVNLQSDDDDVERYFRDVPADGVRYYYLFSLRDRRL